jgi:pantetheine-phosphate adenylyltransferase
LKEKFESTREVASSKYSKQFTDFVLREKSSIFVRNNNKEKMKKRIAIFPGSFDPFTKGHEDIAIRGSQIFDELIIGIGHNSKKQRYFSVEETAQSIREIFAAYPNLKVEVYEGLTIAFAKKHDANFILRGLRNTTDFEYENSIAEANKQIYPDLETVFLITSAKYAHISSTIIREMHKYGQYLEGFMPYKLT